MGVPQQAFMDVHKEKVNEMKRLIMDYIKNIQHLRNRESNIINSQPSDNHDSKIKIKTTEDGYPIIPTTLRCQNLCKGKLTGIIRTYLNVYYSKWNLKAIKTK